MDGEAAGPLAGRNATKVERRSDRELVVTRSFNAPARILFEAWTKPELFKRWWAPRSSGFELLSCEMDVRPGGGYRLEFGRDGKPSMAFFGRYLEVVEDSRLVWTNEESDQGAVTTVSFEERGGATLLTFRELYRTKEALDEVLAGMADGMPEQFEQLDALLASLPPGKL